MTNTNNRKYIIRGDRSGVFYGEIATRNGQEVTIHNCRRIWYWDGAASLSHMALEGIAPVKVRNCKFTVTVDELTVLDAIELIPCTAKACASIEGVPVWRA